MYKTILLKSIKHSLSRLLMIAIALSIGVVMVFGFVSGTNCLNQSSLKWVNAQQYQEEGVSNTVKQSTNPVFVHREMYSCDEKPDNFACKNKSNYFFTVYYILKFAPTDELIDSIKIPENNEFYLSHGIIKDLDIKNIKTQSSDFTSTFGNNFAGELPNSMTVSPDEKIVISGDWQKDSCMKYIPQFMESKSQEYNYQNVSDALKKMTETKTDSKGNKTSEYEYCGESINPVWYFNNYQKPQETASAASFIMDGFKVVGGLCLVFPILLFVAIASGLGAKQKESRLAALRLVGATKKQVVTLITLESLVGAVLGIILGLILFIPVRQIIIQNFTIGGMHFWPDKVNTTPLQSLLILIGLVIFVIFINIHNMKKVNISPLGVVRLQKLKRKPRFRSALPLIISVIGLIWIFINVNTGNRQFTESFYFVLFVMFFILCLVSILISGPYLTYKLASLFAKNSNPVVLLASRRIMNNPGITFKSIAGLVMAMLTGGFLLTISDISSQIIGQNPLIDELVHLVSIGLGLTVFITIASLVVSTLGGLLDRKNSLMTLNLSGVTVGQLKKLVICESLIPMIVTIIISSTIGAFCGVTAWSIVQGVSATASVAHIKGPGLLFWSTDFAVIVLAILAIICILSYIRKIVQIEGSRTE